MDFTWCEEAPKNFMDFTWSGGAQIHFFRDFSWSEEAQNTSYGFYLE